jgi:hypothetical protein
VPTCPSCRALLLANQDALFCERCRATLQTAESLALNLGLGNEDLGRQVQIVRPELAIGACPVCSQGELAQCRLSVQAKVLIERKALLSRREEVFISATGGVRMGDAPGAGPRRP